MTPREEVELRKAVLRWVMEQVDAGRHIVALIPPTEAHDGPRYAGYYCVDCPATALDQREDDDCDHVQHRLCMCADYIPCSACLDGDKAS